LANGSARQCSGLNRERFDNRHGKTGGRRLDRIA
jgi:hypothetical protein